MQEDKTCPEQEPSVGVGGEGQSEGAGQVKGQYLAYPLLVYGKMCFFLRRFVRNVDFFFCENHAAPHNTSFSLPPPHPPTQPMGGGGETEDGAIYRDIYIYIHTYMHTYIHTHDISQFFEI